MTTKKFKYIDLFAGIGGFHLAMDQLGGECVFASEIDSKAAEIYKKNHLQNREGLMHGDIVPLTEPHVRDEIPKHDLLAAGFPCQPFSKGGFQKGINEARGTLFFNIANIVAERKPKFILLENVRNLIGPKHLDTWDTIWKILDGQGYWVSREPTVLSPHLIPPELGGSPQVRERLYIVGIRKDLLTEKQIEDNKIYKLPLRRYPDFSPSTWSVRKHILEADSQGAKLTPDRQLSIDIWSDFLESVGNKEDVRSLPGFPIWEWALVSEPSFSPIDPKWKSDFLRKNSEFYLSNKKAVDSWRKRHPEIHTLQNSYRKFEWQAGSLNSFEGTVMQFRPSGIRVKAASYLPALVAMNQTTYLYDQRRYLSVQEAAKLQGFPSNFDFSNQPNQASYKQLGNAVCVGVVRYVLTETLKHFNLSISGEQNESRN